MHRPTYTAATASLALVAALSCGCGSSGGPSGPAATTSAPTSSTSTSAATAPAGPTSGATSSGAGSGGAGPADPATTAAVTKAYGTFFSKTADVPASEASLQHGTKFAATLQAEAKTAYANKASVTITSVRLASADVADVKFTLKTAGLTLPIDGKSVREDGTWKVAAVTFCGLLQAEGHAPPICSDPSVVGLPG